MQRKKTRANKRNRTKTLDDNNRELKKPNINVVDENEPETTGLLTVSELPRPAVAEACPVERYHTKDKREMLQLQTKLRSDPANKSLKLVVNDAYPDETPGFIVAGTGLLENEFGVYAAEDIHVRPSEGQKFIGVYEGVYRAKMNDEDGKGRRYIFNHGYHGAVIDAEKTRNWAAFINHSELCNVTGLYSSEDGKHEIHLYALRSIAAGEPLFIDYGREYFDVYGFNPMYFGPKDNWRSLTDIWHDNANLYCANTYHISEELRNSLGLLHDGAYVVPKIFIAVIDRNYKYVYQCLNERVDANDIFPLAVDEESGEIAPVSQQEKITPMMLAFHLGDESMIDLFFKRFESVMKDSRDFSLFCDRSWKSGKATLAYLLNGMASKETKAHYLRRFLALKNFMERTCYVNAYFALVDRERQSLLGYCMQQNLPECAELLVCDRGISAKLYDRMMTESKHANIITCIENRDALTLEIILTHAPQAMLKQIHDQVMDGTLNFEQVSKTELNQALPVLTQFLHPSVIKKIQDTVFANDKEVRWSDSSHSMWSVRGMTEMVSGLFRTYGN